VFEVLRAKGDITVVYPLGKRTTTVIRRSEAMTLPAEVTEIQGAGELHDWFGYWPSFHDAEVIGLHLNRKGSSSLRIHTWEMTKDVDEKGYYDLSTLDQTCGLAGSIEATKASLRLTTGKPS
jgi:hypothetical protein